MTKTIILGLILLVSLLPSTVITIETGLFTYEYSAKRLHRRIRQMFNFIKFHWCKLDMEQLIRFYKGGYISKWQLERLWKWFKFDKEMNIN